MNMRTKKDIKDIAKLLRTAGDIGRLNILCIIFDKKDICVSDIAKQLGLSVAITSHHLKVMAKTGLLISNRSGKKICYELPKTPFVRDLKGFICKYK
ncbi:MAG: metalloregulator ArsR/SmtB family transcription factor [bacterium]